MEYLAIAAAVAIAAVLVFLRRQKAHANESFDPTEAMETWDGPAGHFADTIALDTCRSDFKSTSPGVR
jgi:hypothetical protein